MKNIKNDLYVCLFTILCTVLKFPYYNFIKQDYVHFKLENILLYLNDNIILSLIWLAQVIILIIFIIKGIVDDLNVFDHRYSHRKRYLKVKMKKNFFTSLRMIFINYCIQIIMFILIKNESFDLKSIVILFFIFYNVIILSTLFIMSMYLLFHKEVLAMFIWIISVNILQIILSYFKLELFQVLYNCCVLLFMIIIDLISINYIYHDYLKKDFGGNDYEFRS